MGFYSYDCHGGGPLAQPKEVVMRIAFCDVRGLLNDLNDKLGGENGDRWLEKLTNMLREATFPIWRKLQIGFLGPVESLHEVLRDGSFKVSEYASQILNGIKVGRSVTDLELTVITQADLGFTEGTTFENMVARSKGYGLEKCPAEVGPYLRLIYRDQPKGEWLRIAMEPVAGSDGFLDVFYVERDDDGLWLSASWFNPQSVWNPHGRWVFARSRKSP